MSIFERSNLFSMNPREVPQIIAKTGGEASYS